MKTLDYVKTHLDEFEEDDFLDTRFTKRLMEFLPTNEWEKFGYQYTGEGTFTPKEWTEENILEQLREDCEFGLEKAQNERGISSELMAMVVHSWCKVLENDLIVPDHQRGPYHINQFTTVMNHYGWEYQ